MSDLMDKIGALLLKAERSDNEHERDAFLSKAQQLATLASVDLEAARLRQTNKEKRETPTSRTVRLFDAGDRSKTKAYFVWLIVEIGRTQDVRTAISHNSNVVYLYGYPSDIDVTEALYASLSQQMVAECEAWLKTGEYKQEKMAYERKVENTDLFRWNKYDTETVIKPVDGRTARRSFYQGFRNKIVDRLNEAKREAVAAAPAADINGESVSAELVLVSKAETVEEYYRKTSNARGSYRGSGYGGSSTGKSAGSAAGARARMGGGASLGGKTAIGR